jgi:hypothetical protein
MMSRSNRGLFANAGCGGGRVVWMRDLPNRQVRFGGPVVSRHRGQAFGYRRRTFGYQCRAVGCCEPAKPTPADTCGGPGSH